MTNLSTAHLSEEDRQRAADGTRDAADGARIDAHLAECPDCAADVARLMGLMKRIDESHSVPPALPPALDELWPEIRRHIESEKVVALEPASREASRWRLHLDPWLIGTVAAIVAITVIQVVPPIVHSVTTTSVSSDTLLRFAEDSIRNYREEADQLLDELKLQRGRLQPGTQEAIDEDLKTVDLAIAELQAAIARDPTNPTLRAMLASSYRQKVDVLKKITNAG